MSNLETAESDKLVSSFLELESWKEKCNRLEEELHRVRAELDIERRRKSKSFK